VVSQKVGCCCWEPVLWSAKSFCSHRCFKNAVFITRSGVLKRAFLSAITTQEELTVVAIPSVVCCELEGGGVSVAMGGGGLFKVLLCTVECSLQPQCLKLRYRPKATAVAE
jgi:hypothetical protein